jgi:hypothetical protein
MAVASVVFNGTRLNDSDANTGWGNFIVGGGAPASEFPLAYQVTSGTTTGAVNKKITSSAARQGVDYNGSSVDYATNDYLWFCKVYISDAFDLNTTWGVEVAMGSADTSNSHRYNIAGSGANLSVYNQYPAQGGYLITAIDPTIDTWAETADQGGTFDQTAVTWYAVGAQFVNGTAKSENVAMDAIDYGTGLTITAGDGASDPGTFQDFVSADQDTKANRWGVVTGAGDIVRAHGILTIGTASVTEFDDSTSIILFPDGYHSRGKVGIAVGLSHASSVISIGCTMIGEGTRNGADANDTRPDFSVTGSSMNLSLSAQLRNFRDVTLNANTDADGADIECHLLTQASANIENCIIRCNALASVACLQDPTFGATTDLNNTEFIQTGAGHAIEIDTAGDYTFTGLVFTGFSASNNNDASMIDVTASSGTVNITIAGGGTSSISYRTAGATVNIIASTQITLSGLINGTEITVYDSGDGSEIDHVENVTGNSFSFTDSAANVVDIYIHKADYYRADILNFTIPSDDTTIPVSQRFDPNYQNP